MKTAYPKIFHIGTDYIKDLFSGPVEVTEKLDGSQIGFGVFDGELYVRSKGAVLETNGQCAKLFKPAVDFLIEHKNVMSPGYMYYGEYLRTPKHNTLCYNTTPTNGIALFAVSDPTGKFKKYDDVAFESRVVGVGVVPLLYAGEVKSMDELMSFMHRESSLGGPKVEGVVVKRFVHWLFGDIPFPVMAGKYVAEDFKEKNGTRWKDEERPQGKLEKLFASYCTAARWEKSVQHLRDAGKLENSPRDIGPLLHELERDIREEEEGEVKKALFAIFEDELVRAARKGFPEWYKQRVAASSFEGVKNDESNGAVVDSATGSTGELKQ